MSVVDGSFDNTQSLEEHAAMPLAGGLAGMGFQCGQLWGAALAAGAQAYQIYGPGRQAESAAVIAAQRLVERFRASYKGIDCSEVTRLDWKNPKTVQILGFFLKGGPIRCFSMTAGYARAAFNEINASLSDGHAAPISTDAHPISCAAVLAKRMGASDMHAVMAAGFAGGIGLSGGGCGALGAAIWLNAVNNNNGGTLDFNSPEIMDTIDRFVEASEVNFECAEIVGRKFQDLNDHAAYLRAGGCSKIIDILAQPGKQA